MFSDADLKDLVSFISPAPVLSVYLHTDPSERNAETFKLRLKNILKGIDLPADVSEVERFFNHEYDWTGRGVAVFSSSPQQFWRSYTLTLPLPDQGSVSDRPSLKPLTNLLETYGSYGIALVDRQHCRVFYFHLGDLLEGPSYTGEEVKHTKLGGASTVAGMRGGMAGQTKYFDETASRNIKEAVGRASAFSRKSCPANPHWRHSGKYSPLSGILAQSLAKPCPRDISRFNQHEPRRVAIQDHAVLPGIRAKEGSGFAERFSCSRRSR